MVKYIQLFLLIFLIACSLYSNKQLDYALDFAGGENRHEQEKVLQHYSHDPEKLAATHFLIQHMIGKQVWW